MNRNSNIIARKVHDCYFLINIKDNYSDEKCRLYEINEVGYFLWESIPYCNGINELVDKLLEVTFDEISKIDVLNDVQAFVSILYKLGFVES
ncbi:MAG: PqqD family protein [Clostridium sp.]|nr:PqqD family protein [Clostridium sp.]MCM1207296.1 PqqD family protein [Ruminococcus sp.]